MNVALSYVLFSWTRSLMPRIYDTGSRNLTFIWAVYVLRFRFADNDGHWHDDKSS